MTAVQLKPNKVVRDPLFLEPVEVIVTVPMRDAARLVRCGAHRGKVVYGLGRTHEATPAVRFFDLRNERLHALRHGPPVIQPRDARPLARN